MKTLETRIRNGSSLRNLNYKRKKKTNNLWKIICFILSVLNLFLVFRK